MRSRSCRAGIPACYRRASLPGGGFCETSRPKGPSRKPPPGETPALLLRLQLNPASTFTVAASTLKTFPSTLETLRFTSAALRSTSAALRCTSAALRFTLAALRSTSAALRSTSAALRSTSAALRLTLETLRLRTTKAGGSDLCSLPVCKPLKNRYLRWRAGTVAIPLQLFAPNQGKKPKVGPATRPLSNCQLSIINYQLPLIQTMHRSKLARIAAGERWIGRP